MSERKNATTDYCVYLHFKTINAEESTLKRLHGGKMRTLGGFFAIVGALFSLILTVIWIWKGFIALTGSALMVVWILMQLVYADYGSLGRIMADIGDRGARFASLKKHVELSVPFQLVRQLEPDMVESGVNPLTHPYCALQVAAADPKTGAGGEVTFIPRSYEKGLYTHLMMKVSSHEMDVLLKFIRAVKRCDKEYFQRLTDIYIFPGRDHSAGWYCVQLTMAALQSMGKFRGVSPTEASTQFIMSRSQQWYGAQYVGNISTRIKHPQSLPGQVFTVETIE